MDEELLRLWATHRNREAADRLIRRHEQALFAFAQRLARSEAEAAEIVQETCLRLLQKAAQFQGRSSLRTWMFGIALNVARSRRFRLQKLRALFKPIEEQGEQTMKDESSREKQHAILAKVDEALASMPREARVPILLHYYQGFDYEQMAEILDCPSGTVASRLHAARKKLEAKLRRSGVDLAALGSLEMLREGASAPLPASLHQALRALPQKALTPTLAAPVTGMGALVAGGLAAVTLLGSAYFLHAEATGGRKMPEWMSAPPLRAMVSPRPASASLRSDRAPVGARTSDCEERSLASSRQTAGQQLASFRAAAKGAAEAASLFQLEVTGAVRDAELGFVESCAEVSVRAVWPPRARDAEDPFFVAATKTDENGAYALAASSLEAGVYEIATSESFACPRFVVLGADARIHHDFFRVRANGEEQTALVHSYRDDLSRALETFFLETGQSALQLRLIESESVEPEVFVFDESGERVEPLARVFQPIANNLLLGPLPAGSYRVEIMQPGRGTAVLQDLRVGNREIAEAVTSLRAAEEFFSVEVVDGASHPVAGARVELQPGDFWAYLPFASGVTDVAGRVCFEGVPCRVHVRVARPAAPGSVTVPCKIYCGQASSGTTMRVVID